MDGEGCWLICGGRHFNDRELFHRTMVGLLLERGRPGKVVHGGGGKADEMGGCWAHNLGIPVHREQAKWNVHGRAAGPIRNQKMLDDHHPTLGIALPGGAGTADMVRRMQAAGIEVIEVSYSPTPADE